MNGDELPFTSAELLVALNLVLPPETATAIADGVAYLETHGSFPPGLEEDQAEPSHGPVQAGPVFVADASLYALIAELFPERRAAVWDYLCRVREREKSLRPRREIELLAGSAPEDRSALEAALIREDADFARLWDEERARSRDFLNGIEYGSRHNNR